MDKSLLILGGILFLAVFLAVEGIYLWWNSTRGPEMRRISRRLQTMSAGGAIDSESARLFKQRLINNSKGFSRILLRMPRMATLDRYLLQSGMELSVTTISGITLGLFAVVFLLLLTLFH